MCRIQKAKQKKNQSDQPVNLGNTIIQFTARLTERLGLGDSKR